MMKRLFFYSIVWFYSLTAIAQKELKTDDRTYDRNIKTVLLYPTIGAGNINNGVNRQALSPSIAPMGSNFILEFDELGYEFKNYYVKILNCNADWSISDLNPVNYLDDYNEFFIQDRKVSVGTRLSYIHYRFVLPVVKQSGNYLVKVYREYDEEDFVITRRFSVYENGVTILPTIKFSLDPSARNTHQQIDFILNYTTKSGLDIVNPTQTLKVLIRQNHRWDRMITDLAPVTINEQSKVLEYFYFNRENNFNGGNEFRMFDFTSGIYTGMNVAKLRKDSSRAYVYLYPDKSVAGMAYTQPLNPDFDGKYLIYNNDTNDGEYMADYMYVTFTLESPSPVNGKVYILGSMTDWRLNKSFEMIYDSEKRIYTCEALLKQGYYNYRYVLANTTTWAYDETYFEGNHSETQNVYDILVYYRPFGSRSDRLIGYNSSNYMGRR